MAPQKSQLLPVRTFQWSLLGVIVLLIETIGHPSPIMSRVNPDEPGVYSLFPNENLRTGKSLNPPYTSDPDRYRGRELERDPYNTARQNRHFDAYDQRLRQSDSQRSNRILFDDERLNYPSRPRPRPHFRPEYHERPPVSIYSQEYPGQIIPAFPQSKLPPARSGEEEARIHVFNPDSNSFGRPGLAPVIPLIEPKSNHHAFPPEDVDIQPGRILIPGHNSIMNLREPGPDSFLNHDEYLDYHTKAAIDAIKVLDKKERKTDARKLLFSSANIAGLVPPKLDGEDDEENSSEPETTPQFRLSHKDKAQTVTLPPEEEVTVTSGTSSTPKGRRLHDRPVLQNGFVPIRPFRVKGEVESPRLRDVKAGKLQLRPETTSRPTTTNKPPPVTFSPTYSYPYVKKSSPITRITVTKAPLLVPTVTETILPFTQVVDTDELGSTRLRTEIPLIFLETQEKIVGGLPKGKKMVVVKRLKANIREFQSLGSSKNTNTTPSSVESTMRIHKSEVESGENFNKDGLSSTEFNLQQSSSATGVVAKIHAHVSNCPKLHGPAEIICDVHIRKRHGSPNPQLSVGWKRKFHNGTTPDLVLAVNKTLAYVEQDFHDKFNVTLAPGISPMLRSVLSIRHVSPSDTGNYQCEVNDGENKLRSDTLLFLCH